MSKSEYVVSVVDDELRDISITKEIVQQPEKFKSPGSGKKKYISEYLKNAEILQ